MLDMVGSPCGHSSSSDSFCIIISASAVSGNRIMFGELNRLDGSPCVHRNTSNAMDLTAISQIGHVRKGKCKRHNWY